MPSRTSRASSTVEGSRKRRAPAKPALPAVDPLSVGVFSSHRAALEYREAVYGERCETKAEIRDLPWLGISVQVHVVVPRAPEAAS